jgi:hypothetical protein
LERRAFLLSFFQCRFLFLVVWIFSCILWSFLWDWSCQSHIRIGKLNFQSCLQSLSRNFEWVCLLRWQGSLCIWWIGFLLIFCRRFWRVLLVRGPLVWCSFDVLWWFPPFLKVDYTCVY